MRAKAQDVDLVDALFQLSFRLHGTLARIAAAHDLSIIQVRLLGILRDREPGMLELARHLKLEKSSLSGLVDRAEERGLVERVPSTDDRRVSNIRVTDQGRKLSRVLEEKVNAEIVSLVGVLSRSDRDRLTARERSRARDGRDGGGGTAMGESPARSEISAGDGRLPVSAASARAAVSTALSSSGRAGGPGPSRSTPAASSAPMSSSMSANVTGLCSSSSPSSSSDRPSGCEVVSASKIGCRCGERVTSIA